MGKENSRSQSILMAETLQKYDCQKYQKIGISRSMVLVHHLEEKFRSDIRQMENVDINTFHEVR